MPKPTSVRLPPDLGGDIAPLVAVVAVGYEAAAGPEFNGVPLRLPPEAQGYLQPVEVDAPGGLVVVGANGSGKSRLGLHLLDLNHGARFVPTLRDIVAPDRVEAAPTPSPPPESPPPPAPGELERGEFERMIVRAERDRQDRNDVFTAGWQNPAREGRPAPSSPPQTTFERAAEIWHRAFPHRTLRLSKGVLQAGTPDGLWYPASQMSDGERSALHLILRCLSETDGALIVVDEPEAHFHRAVVGRVWDEIEREAPSALFVYLTHDLDFAAGRVGATTLWLRGYWRDRLHHTGWQSRTAGGWERRSNADAAPAERWSWTQVEPVPGLPEPLLLEVLGARRPTLFVEGTRGSLDAAVYTHVYPDWHVVPVGGGDQVRRAVGGLRDAPGTHRRDAAGITDRDRKTDRKAEGLSRKGLRVLGVAEIENVLLLDGPVRALAGRCGLDPDATVAAVHQRVADYVRSVLGRQVREHVEARLRTTLSGLLSQVGEPFSEGARRALDGVDPMGTEREVRAEFGAALGDGDHAMLLRLCNDKGMPSLLRDELDLSTPLPSYVARALAAGDVPDLLAALQDALPDLPVPTSGQVTGAVEPSATVVDAAAATCRALDDAGREAVLLVRGAAATVDAFEAAAREAEEAMAVVQERLGASRRWVGTDADQTMDRLTEIYDRTDRLAGQVRQVREPGDGTASLLHPGEWYVNTFREWAGALGETGAGRGCGAASRSLDRLATELESLLVRREAADRRARNLPQELLDVIDRVHDVSRLPNDGL